MSKIKRDIHQEVTDRILEQMETCGTNWIKPFTSGGHQVVNRVTKAPYNGINILLLGMTGHTEWASYKQWATMGAQVKKGEKGTTIVFFKAMQKESTCKTTGESKINRFGFLRYSTVFHIGQLENAPKSLVVENVPAGDAERLQAVEEYVSNTGADLRTGDSRGAFFSPGGDFINMPELEAFSATESATATENYYSTLLHELTHWTGSAKRLERIKTFSRPARTDYAFEELVAELGAAYQCVSLGITSEPRADHAQYLNGWLRALKNDKKFIFEAAAQASKAVKFIEELQPAELQQAA